MFCQKRTAIKESPVYRITACLILMRGSAERALALPFVAMHPNVKELVDHFEAGLAAELVGKYPDQKGIVERLSNNGTECRLPDGYEH